MKNKIYIIIIFSIFQFLNAQSDYYYYRNGQQVFLELDRNFLNIITTSSFNTSQTNGLGFKEYTLKDDNTLTSNKFAKVESTVTPTSVEFTQKINSLKSNPNIKGIGLYFKNSAGAPIGTSNYFYVKLKTPNDFGLLQQFSSTKNVQIVKQVPNMPLWYVLSVTNTDHTSLELSNQFYESDIFADTDPAFMFSFGYDDDSFTENNSNSTNSSNCANDPMFSSQWALDQANNHYNIRACQAWEITTGVNVNVAVLDTGIDLEHNDLSANIHPLSYNATTGTSPSSYIGWYGTHVAGVIGAIKNNNLQIAGVAPSSKLMSVSFEFLNDYQLLSVQLADGISWAYQNGADIINNSWAILNTVDENFTSPILEQAINDAITLGRDGKGTIVIFAAGNGVLGDVHYPANSNPEILTVGAMNQEGFRVMTSAYGANLDVVAPGFDILSTIPNNDTGWASQTSFATPHVSGIAALMLSVNPCLTGQQVRDIIEQTAQKVKSNTIYSYQNQTGKPNGIWNEQMGYGLVDAYAAVQMAQQTSSTYDLMVKDNLEDTGEEPNNIEVTWESPDIWVRNSNDGIVNQFHENPLYEPNNPNFVYVKVKNIGCSLSSGLDKITLYWSKASSSMSFPEDWNGYFPNGGPLRGNQIGTILIPPLGAGEETIIEFEWNNIPDPLDYSDIDLGEGFDEWHFCLLASISDLQNPTETTNNTYLLVKNNNNVAQKNVYIVDLQPRIGGTFLVGNPINDTRNFNLNFLADNEETGKLIFQEAEVSITLNDVLLNAWKQGGEQAGNIRKIKDNVFLITGDNASLNNLVLEKDDIGLLNVQFNFLTKEITEKQKYIYRAIQRYASDNQVTGGETFEIIKDPRALFYADAGDTKFVDKNEVVTLNAELINEPAIYNWYDSEGNLIYEGADFNMSVEVGKKYKLEVITLLDGYKDYSEVEVKFNPNEITSAYPNPTSGIINIEYKINEGESAYLAVSGIYGTNASDNYVLDINQNNVSLNIADYQTGIYLVALIVNGEIADTKTIIKQ